MTRLPSAVSELLTSRIDSFEKLELVTTLHGAPRTTMSVDDLCKAIKLPRDSVRQAAVELRAAAVVDFTSSGEVQLLQLTTRDQTAVTELAHYYKEDRLALVKALGEIAVERIRGMAARAFADAFVLAKKQPSRDDG